ncbi:ATP synthase subunit I [Anaerosalibacter massiliensis]|uniref:ATP synthase subunit I n=1 Tax=Anaerosalibacter massiliensis TaxID=1347392 RepID=A0A9X2S5L9_9FIRM|nr:ATP synthase subunit I [Anaerosalibacter massiliensis]MCR2044698.1 ATP synthase subunit I [Anaerosalibacter massiliensis]
MLRDKEIIKIIKRTIALSLVVIGILLIVMKNGKTYALGMFFGSSIGILNFILMGSTINKAVQMDSKSAYGYSVRNYFIRYLIYFVVLSVAALADYLSFVTTALGLFMIKIVILSSAVYDTIKVRNRRKLNKK